MHNVQIAIQDRAYAEALRSLLMADGQHQVYVVDRPSPAVDGVVVVDHAIELSVGFDFDRCVLLTRKVLVEVTRLWELGLRHVIYADYPPDVGRLVILAAERRLGSDAVIKRAYIFDESDRSFLEALKISVL
jgi:hypothetical protein